MEETKKVQDMEPQVFLVQVTGKKAEHNAVTFDDRTYADEIIRYNYYRHEGNISGKDQDFTRVKVGDYILVYCGHDVKESPKMLKYIYQVVGKEFIPENEIDEVVKSGKITLEDAEELKRLPRVLRLRLFRTLKGLEREKIKELVNSGKLSSKMGKCGDPGFNIAKVEYNDLETILELDGGEEMNETVGLIGVIAWSEKRWQEFDLKGYENRDKYGPSFVKEAGFGYEWWNFYNKFDNKNYIGHIEAKSITKFKKGSIIFVSRNIYDGKWYFVGFYGDGEYNQNEFKTGVKVKDLFPDEVVKDLEERLVEIGAEDVKNDIIRVLNGSAYSGNIRCGKENSAVFDPECYVKITPKDIGVKGIGNMTFTYIDQNKIPKIRNLLVKAKQKHEQLLQQLDISEERKNEIEDIIKKIDFVLSRFSNNDSNGREKLKSAIQREKEKYSEYWNKNSNKVLKVYQEFLERVEAGEDPREIYEDHINKYKEILDRYKDIDRLFWFNFGVAGSKRLDDISVEKFREFIREMKDARTENDAWNVFENYKDVIKGMKGVSLSTWGSIIHPKWFCPLWWDYNRGIINRYNASLLGIEHLIIETRATPTIPLEKFYEIYPNLVKKIKKASEELGIHDLLEATFYLSKAKVNNDWNPPLHEYLATRGYLFPPYLVAQFYAALKTKGFVILSGLSGTGKTKIAQEFCSLLGETILLQVHPDWRDSKPLIGWYNPLDGSYSRTPLLDFILKAKEDYDNNRESSKPYFIILDEMNLAHVEYYFADFLSVLESGRDEDGYTRDSIKLHNVDGLDVPKELRLPPNLYIIGTVNVDETTYTFSPKVLDRAFTIEFHDVDLSEYPPEKPSNENTSNVSVSEEIFKDFTNDGKFLGYSKEEINRAVEEFKNEKNKKYWNALTNLNKALEPYDLHFGYRIVDEIALFFKNAKESSNRKIIEFQSDDEIFDLAILMKILPKFHGNRRKLEKPLSFMLKLAKRRNGESEKKIEDVELEAILEEMKPEKLKNYRYKHTAKKVLRMLRQLYEVGFASFS